MRQAAYNRKDGERARRRRQLSHLSGSRSSFPVWDCAVRFDYSMHRRDGPTPHIAVGGPQQCARTDARNSSMPADERPITHIVREPSRRNLQQQSKHVRIIAIAIVITIVIDIGIARRSVLWWQGRYIMVK
jgi:hypothetical protein